MPDHSAWLRGKTVLVTGGAYGIGRAIVMRAATLGAAAMDPTAIDLEGLRRLRELLVQRLETSERCVPVHFGMQRQDCPVTSESANPSAHASFRLWGLLAQPDLRPFIEHLRNLPIIRAVASARLGGDYQLHGCTAYVAAPSEEPNVSLIINRSIDR